MFFTYGEEKEEQKSPVCCEIKDSRFFIAIFYQRFYQWIIKY